MRRVLQEVDWSQLWYPGPTRSFSDEQLSDVGGEGPGPTFWMVLGFNLAILVGQILFIAPAPARAPVAGVSLLSCLAMVPLIQALWRRPSRRRLMLFMCAWAGAAVAVAALGQRLAGWSPVQHLWTVSVLAGSAGIGTMGLWMLALYRAHSIESRLKELAERAEALALARRLSAAQLQPHFLFNTLASIQHWVDTGDGRAGPTLRALTDYLRALLPMFEQPLHPLADELAAMRRYLEVMQSRLGDRLRHRMALAPDASSVRLPPGLGLTLLENAVEHGAQASLHGAEVEVRTRAAPGGAWLEVLDTGPGLAVPHVDGTGLRNCRERLRQCFGAAASLTLAARDDGPGCVARVFLPTETP